MMSSNGGRIQDRKGTGFALRARLRAMTPRVATIVVATAGVVFVSGCASPESHGGVDDTFDAAPTAVFGCDSNQPLADHIEDVTSGSGLYFTAYSSNFAAGAGIAVEDVDGDDLVDVLAVSRQRGVGLFRNTGDFHFEDVTVAAGIDPGLNAGAVGLADLDNDGDKDAVIAGPGGTWIYENAGDGTFADVSSRSTLDAPRLATFVVFVDLDNDRRLDVYIGNRHEQIPGALYRNGGSLSFESITVASSASDDGIMWAGSVFDVDGDGDLEIYLAVDAGVQDFGGGDIRPTGGDEHDHLLWNDGLSDTGGVALRERGPELGLHERHSSMGGVVSDFNGDGSLDLYVPNYGQNKLYLAIDGDQFAEDSASFGVSATNEDPSVCDAELSDDCLLVSWGAAAVDTDLNGRDELIMVNGLYTPQSSVRFEQTGWGASFGESLPALGCFNGRALVPADVDADGDLDFVVTTFDGPVRLFRTTAPAQHDWLSVRLLGTQSNRDGIGAVVTATRSDGAVIRRPVGAGGIPHGWGPLDVHFGLADLDVTSIEVRWPSGLVQLIEAGELRGAIEIVEPVP